MCLKNLSSLQQIKIQVCVRVCTRVCNYLLDVEMVDGFLLHISKPNGNTRPLHTVTRHVTPMLWSTTEPLNYIWFYKCGSAARGLKSS